MTNLTELPSNAEPPTWEGIEVEHRLWILVVVNLLRSTFWQCRLTVKELMNGEEENTETREP